MKKSTEMLDNMEKNFADKEKNDEVKKYTEVIKSTFLKDHIS